MCFMLRYVVRWFKSERKAKHKICKLATVVMRGDVHWTAIVVDTRTQTIGFMDSIQLGIIKDLHRVEYKALIGFLAYEWEAHGTSSWLPLPIVEEHWSMKVIGHGEAPRQYNGYDCGLFCLRWVEHSLQEVPVTYTQRDMDEHRSLLVLELLRKRPLREKQQNHKEKQNAERVIFACHHLRLHDAPTKHVVELQLQKQANEVTSISTHYSLCSCLPLACLVDMHMDV